MRKIGHLLLLLCALRALAAPRIKVIKLAVMNPTDQARTAEDITVGLTALARVAPDLRGPVIVTTSDAATLEEDAHTLQTVELPSQIQAEELAFQIELKPKQTRVVTIAYGDQVTIGLLRRAYPHWEVRRSQTAKVQILSETAVSEPAPADTAVNIHRTYKPSTGPPGALSH